MNIIIHSSSSSSSRSEPDRGFAALRPAVLAATAGAARWPPRDPPAAARGLLAAAPPAATLPLQTNKQRWTRKCNRTGHQHNSVPVTGNRRRFVIIDVLVTTKRLVVLVSQAFLQALKRASRRLDFLALSLMVLQKAIYVNNADDVPITSPTHLIKFVLQIIKIAIARYVGLVSVSKFHFEFLILVHEGRANRRKAFKSLLTAKELSLLLFNFGIESFFIFSELGSLAI